MTAASMNCSSNATECSVNKTSVTECETKFILDPTSSEMDSDINLLLTWNCPFGNILPPKPLLDYICREIFRSRNVLGCSSPSGLILPQNGSNILPNTTWVKESFW